MKNVEKGLSRYIDDLNDGRKPREHSRPAEDEQYGRLLETVRRVRALREPEYPGADYAAVLAKALQAGAAGEAMAGNKTFQGGVDGEAKAGNRTRHGAIKRIVFAVTAAAAAVVILVIVPKLVLPVGNPRIVFAMEKAFKEVKAYHGIIEVRSENKAGEAVTQSTREVWADNRGNYCVKELEGTAAGTVTVNNGEQKWQLQPEEQTAYLFAGFPDPYRFTFELAQEIEDVRAAQTVKEIGTDMVAGRTATLLEVTPDGGEPYRLWIDGETHLPLRKETAMQNALRYTVSYSSIEFLEEIPAELLKYQLPDGFRETDIDAEQIVATPEEAEGMVGFLPVVPDQLPEDFALDKLVIREEQTAVGLVFTSKNQGSTVMIRQSKASGEFKPASSAMLGTIGGSTAELLAEPAANSIRWREGGMEYTVLGDVDFNLLTSFAAVITDGEIVLPSGLDEKEDGIGENTPEQDASEWAPQVSVSVDLQAEENGQKSVDAGHSPWKLDPAFVAQVFASLLLSPEGIEGDYPIAYDSITMIQNDGVRAVAQINDKASLAGKVYLERLVRQDDTGIWTVVGYDKAE